MLADSVRVSLAAKASHSDSSSVTFDGSLRVEVTRRLKHRKAHQKPNTYPKTGNSDCKIQLFAMCCNLLDQGVKLVARDQLHMVLLEEWCN